MQFLITAIVVVILLLGVLSSCPSFCKCNDNSNGVNVFCSNRGLDTIPTYLPNKTYEFYLDYNTITSIKSHAFNNVPSLYMLDLQHNNISVIEDNAFNNLPKLQHLYLQSNKITSINLNTFNNLKNLTVVYLQYNKITSIMSDTFSNLKNLTFLFMGNNPISFISENAFENLTQRALFVFEMYCGGCDNIPFWRRLNRNRTLRIAITCYDYDGERLSNLQLNNFTDCFKCSLGYYGYNCNESCDGCLSNSCDKVYGICTDTSGCKPGWQPGHEKCNLACLCGTYGQNCNEICADECYACHPVSGICLPGCSKGWMGPYCKQECITGRYGINCESHCHTCVNKICDRLDGHCTHGCIDGFRGVGCHTTDTSQSDSQITNYIYTGVGTFFVTVLICVIIVVTTLRYRGKKGDGRTEQQNGQNMRELDNDAFTDQYTNIGASRVQRHML